MVKNKSTQTHVISAVIDIDLGYLWDVQRGSAHSYLVHKSAVAIVTPCNTLSQTSYVTTVAFISHSCICGSAGGALVCRGLDILTENDRVAVKIFLVGDEAADEG